MTKVQLQEKKTNIFAFETYDQFKEYFSACLSGGELMVAIPKNLFVIKQITFDVADEEIEICSINYDDDEGGYVLDVDEAYSKDNMKGLFDKYDIVSVGVHDLKKLF